MELQLGMIEPQQKSVQHYYSPSADGFFINLSSNRPDDCIPISEEDYKKFLRAKNEGALIVLENGQLKLTPPKKEAYQDWDGTKWIENPVKKQAFLKDSQQKLAIFLKNKADEFGNKLLWEFPEIEKNSFGTQKKEAEDYKSGKNLKPTFLLQLVEKRKIPLDILVEKVLDKAHQYEVRAGIITGYRQAFMDEIESATTIDQLNDIKQKIQKWKFEDVMNG